MYRDGATALDEHDRAVGAILIGETLIAQCERAAVIARDPHAAERWRTLRDAHDDYPEIWRQLDRACQVLAARGGNTAGYEELRPHVRTSVVALGDDGEQRIDPAALDDARRAIAELKLAVPGADWGAIDKRTRTLVGTPQLLRRHWVPVSSVLGVAALLIATWFIGSMPEKKVSDRELMRRELADVTVERKMKIEYLRHAVADRCNPPVAQEYVKLLVFDGRGDDAETFADDYLGRCGDDAVVANWANAPRPSRR